MARVIVLVMRMSKDALQVRFTLICACMHVHTDAHTDMETH